MTFGSLFAGIGGFDLGLERAGMTCKWQVEIDDYATKVLEKHWPHVKRYRDVREVGAHNLEPVDLICGGFPCQDLSCAGDQAGIQEGTRSGLWLQYARIIRELRPQWVLAENVPGLLSANAGRDMGRILGDLAACGLDVEWQCIPASAFGAPHLRERVWILAYTQHAGLAWRRRVAVAGKKGHELRGILHTLPSGMYGQTEAMVSNAYNSRRIQQARREQNGRRRLGDCAWWETEPAVERVAYGVPNGVDRDRCLGNAVVPQVAEWIGRRIMEAA